VGRSFGVARQPSYALRWKSRMTCLHRSVLAQPHFVAAATTALMKVNPFGVPRPVTLSHPGPVVSDESVPKTKTSQRVELELWKSALTKFAVFPSVHGGSAQFAGAARSLGLSWMIAGGLGGVLGIVIVPLTLLAEPI